MNLLIVDDEAIAIEGMRLGVDWRACGVDGEVFIAYDAAQAMAVLDSRPVDVVLCDIEMPGESGIELLRRVRERNLDVAFIILTCHAKFEYAQEAVRLGCEDYILTPAPYSQIGNAVFGMVNRLIEKRAKESAAKYGAQWLEDQARSAREAQGDHRTPAEIAESAARYILENLSGALSVKRLAGRLYLNADYLNRIFKREKGVSINQFIIRERMALAARLLENRALSISTIAAQVGYQSYPYFDSTFKRVYGVTPTQYRERMGGK